MAQANVAREPSMEEILASIRKIIESNDDPEAESATDPVPDGAPSAAAVARPDEGPAGRNPEAADGRSASMPSTPSPGLSDPPKPAATTGKDMLQGARHSAFAPRGLPGDPVRTRPAAAPPPPSKPVSLAQLAAEADGGSSDRMEQTGHSGKPVTEKAPEPVVLDDPGSPGVRAAPGVDKMAPQSQPESSLLDAPGKAPALISPEAGAKVAASFDSLNDAVVNGPGRSFDEIAEDMLRPMLQQWLDDNLPTLVERLVREEIERVARGR